MSVNHKYQFSREDFLSTRDFVRMQYGKTAKHEHTILRFISGMEIFMLVFGYFDYNHENPRMIAYMSLYAALAIVSILTDVALVYAEKKDNFRTNVRLSVIGYFYFAFIVAWGLAITTLDVTHGGRYWVAATVIMAISVFLNLNPFYTVPVVTLAGTYLCFLSAFKAGRFTASIINIIIFTMVDCLIILKNYFTMYDNAYMEYKLEQLSIRDGLTGVNNRRAMDQFAVEHRDVIKSIAIVDVDNFKQINDGIGHKAGDEALLRVTSLFREYFNDLEIYRYGGDEFVFLSTRNVPETAKKLEKINLKLTISGGPYPIHISGGVTATSAEKAIADSIASADELLYKAKETGKGKILAG